MTPAKPITDSLVILDRLSCPHQPADGENHTPHLHPSNPSPPGPSLCQSRRAPGCVGDSETENVW